MAFTIRLLVVFLCVSVSACKHILKPQDPANPAAPVQEEKETESEQFSDFDAEKDTLYDLIVGEIAAQRQQFNVTLINYIHQARATRDVEIIKRAINAAQYVKDLEAITEMASLWIEVDPESVPAHQLLAFQYSVQQRLTEAMVHIDKIIELGGDARVDSLAIGSQALPPEKKLELIGLYEDLYEKYPNEYEVGHSLALLYRDKKQFDQALSLLNPILDKHPDFEPSVLLKTSILTEMGDLEIAEDYAAEQYESFPHNHALGRMYASLLIDNKDLDKAEEVFASLVERFPQASGLKLSRALVMLENKKTEESKLALEALLKEGVHLNESHFYLGRIADIKEDIDTAINHYFQVDEGIHYEAALERATYLLVKAERADEALEHLNELRTTKPERAEMLWLLQYKLLSSTENDALALETLNQSLEAFPLNEQLLYARAMTYDQQGKLEEMEADLRVIIKNNPQHAVAINALGYTLADKTDRTQEALSLITLALSLKPDNPAIQDSMGWVLYRLNKPEDALVLLLNAYNNYPDPEVAAHLGEVLFVLERKKQAMQVWQKAFMKTPDHKVLNSTLERMAPEWLEIFKQGGTPDVQDYVPEEAENSPTSEQASGGTIPSSEASNDTEVQ